MGDEELMNDESQSETQPTIAEPDIAPSGRVKLEAQIKALQNALEQRSQMPFNPTLMAMASGFLKPSLTGGFGESLGYALEGGAKAMETERSRRSELEKLKLDLALKQYDLARKEQARGMLNRIMTGEGAPKTTLSQTEGGEEAPEKTVNVTPQQAVKVVGKMPQAIYKMTMTPEIVAALGAVDEETGKLAQKIFENQKGMVQIGQKQEEIDIRGKEVGQKEFDTVERQNPFDPATTIRIPRNKVADFDRVASEGNPIEMSKFLAKTGIPGYFGKTFGEAPSEGFKPPPTQSERETEKLKKEERIKSDIKKDEENKEKIFSNQANAQENLIPNATSIYRYANNPETSKAFGYLASKGLGNAVATLAENGVTVGNWRIGLTDVSDSLRKIDPNISQKDIEAAQAVAQNMARLELGFSQAFKGQGQVSDFERKIVQNIGPQKSDTARVASLKSEMILARAKLDDITGSLYQQWRENNPDKYVTDFKNTPEYRKLVRQYNAKLGQIQDKYGF